MSKSVLTISAACFVFVASVVIAFVVGASVVQREASSRLVLMSSEFEIRNDQVSNDQVSKIDSKNQGTPTGTFSFQGVLYDESGAPASGPVQLTFTVFSTLPTPINFISSVNIVNIDENGLFETIIPLPDPEVFTGIESLGVRVVETMTNEIIAIPSVRHTPRAWFSEYAVTSGFAESAAFADEAQEAAIAQTADALTNDQTVSITLAQDFSPGVFGGQAPYATRLGNMVFLNGIFSNDVANPNGMIIGTLPPNMRPSSSQVLAIHSNLSTSSGNAAVTITDDGTIRMFSSNYSAGFSFFLNGAYFTIDE